MKLPVIYTLLYCASFIFINPLLQISRLKMRKDELERQEREGRRMRRQLAVATAEHVSTTLEICPRFVVPDTNCFIDHLADLRQIALTGLFGVRVPVVVLGELDGLAKGQQAGPRVGARTAEHAASVAESARRALSFLHSGAAAASVKPVTTKGSTLNSLGITTEEDSLRDGPGTGKSLAFHQAFTRNFARRKENLYDVKQRLIY